MQTVEAIEPASVPLALIEDHAAEGDAREVRAEKSSDGDDAVAQAEAAAEEAIATFESACVAEVAAMRAGTASLGTDGTFMKLRVDALAAMGRADLVKARAERRRAAPPAAPRLRATKPRNMVRGPAMAEALFRAAPLEQRMAPDHPCLRNHDLQVALLIGDDLTPDEKAAEAFDRLCREIGIHVATDLVLDAAERDESGHAVALILRGEQLPAIAMPPGEAEQRLYTRLLVLERDALADRPGIGPVPTREDQSAARHTAWRALIEEERRTEAHHRKSHAQVEREIAARLPGWAEALGMTGPR